MEAKKKLGRPFTVKRDKWFSTRASQEEIDLIAKGAKAEEIGQMDFIIKLVKQASELDKGETK